MRDKYIWRRAILEPFSSATTLSLAVTRATKIFAQIAVRNSDDAVQQDVHLPSCHISTILLSGDAATVRNYNRAVAQIRANLISSQCEGVDSLLDAKNAKYAQESIRNLRDACFSVIPLSRKSLDLAIGTIEEELHKPQPHTYIRELMCLLNILQEEDVDNVVKDDLSDEEPLTPPRGSPSPKKKFVRLSSTESSLNSSCAQFQGGYCFVPSVSQVENWDACQVCEWLMRLGLSSCSQIFANKGVTGQELLFLEHLDMKMIGVPVDYCTSIVNAIKVIRGYTEFDLPQNLQHLHTDAIDTVSYINDLPTPVKLRYLMLRLRQVTTSHRCIVASDSHHILYSVVQCIKRSRIKYLQYTSR